MLVKCKYEKCAYPKTIGRFAQKQQSFKECVTAHLSRISALKIIWAKPAADIFEHFQLKVIL